MVLPLSVRHRTDFSEFSLTEFMNRGSLFNSIRTRIGSMLSSFPSREHQNAIWLELTFFFFIQSDLFIYACDSRIHTYSFLLYFSNQPSKTVFVCLLFLDFISNMRMRYAICDANLILFFFSLIFTCGSSSSDRFPFCDGGTD